MAQRIDRSWAVIVITLSLLTFTTRPASAQWVEESYLLKAGWNAIWLPIDASHDTIGNLFPATVEEVWRWNPASSTTQFTLSPTESVDSDTPWLVWRRDLPVDSTMTTLAGNAAYLLKVDTRTADFTLSLTGIPVPPRYQWASSGLNFFGFPTKSPEKNFETFLSYTEEISAGADIFKYVGGPITDNPVAINSPLFEPVTRGRAYWIRSSQFSDYYGPLRITIARSGLAFGDTGTVLTLKIRNVTGKDIDVTLTPVASATPQSGPINAGQVPLRLRGALNPGTGSFDYDSFTAATNISLDAGEERELVFAVDRAAMADNTGDSFQSILQITDSLGISRIDLPVSAVTTSRSGLWVGAAVVTTVAQITTAPSAAAGEDPASFSTDADASAPSAFPVRLIVHHNDAGVVKLLQQVFVGADATGEMILTTDESKLDPTKLAYSVRRGISLMFANEAAEIGLSDLGWGSTVLGGDYAETITGLRAQAIEIKGSFVLRRVSDIPTLLSE